MFKLYTVENNKVIGTDLLLSSGSGHGALAGVLSTNGVEVLICGGIGGGAKNALAEAGIKLYGGVSGDADTAVEEFLNGKLNYNPNVMCSHHSHEAGHSCGSHSCGEHNCGNH